MKIITQYEAYDGTVFTTAKECRKYEQLNEVKIKNDFEKLILKHIRSVTNSYPFNILVKNVDEYAVIKMETEDDYKSLVNYAKLVGCEDQAHREFNKKIIVHIRFYDADIARYVNFLHWIGTEEECIENFANMIIAQ